MKALILIAALLLSSCQTMDAGKTVAGGANGTIDYCIKFLSTELLCINAKREMENEVTP